MTAQKKPYLVIPYLVEQPTWGGEYILETKNWAHKPKWKGKKIGQSYELYSNTKLALGIDSSTDNLFGPECVKTIDIKSFQETQPFPLIKFTQAKGNSFQVHAKPGAKGPHWQPKAESWYYFEPGKITLGIKKDADLTRYKMVCKDIDVFMHQMSEKVKIRSVAIDHAKQQIVEYIAEKNPWQFVNVYDVPAETLIDLSCGGLHHSWEEDEGSLLGNVLYEIQQDVMDPVSTIRSFDQGKIMDDGSIREIQIDDYFAHLDVSTEKNTYIPSQVEGEALFKTPYYSLSRLAINGVREMETTNSFHHIFVKEGGVTVSAKKGEVEVMRGHSCFIPRGVSYTIQPKHPSIVLLTFV